MNKKILPVIMAILLIGSGVGAIAVAKPLRVEPTTDMQFHPDYPSKNIIIGQGVAVNKDNLNTQPAVFLLLKSDGKTNVYLVIGDQLYAMNVTKNQYDDELGVRTIQATTTDGKVLTLVADRGDFRNGLEISGYFEGQILTFRPIYMPYKYQYEKPVDESLPAGLETKAVGKGVARQNALKQLSSAGVNISKIVESMKK